MSFRTKEFDLLNSVTDNSVLTEHISMADPLEKQLGIALQRFERGDLVVRLSSVVNDILILPTSLLIEKSKWFEAALTRWQEPALAKGACVLTYQLGLTYHADLQSWSLSSRVSNF